jgi:tagatose 6-phosphate kinase
MILVVSLNPALDVTHHVARADWAGVNRPHDVSARPGGKGLNVARTLTLLGADVLVIGLVGGAAGEAVQSGLGAARVREQFTAIEAQTRRTFAVVDTVRGQTALFNEPGPVVSEAEYDRFRLRYRDLLAGSAAVVLSGSLPGALPPGTYAELTELATEAGVPVLLDTDGLALRLGAAGRPAIVKPNLEELERSVGRSLRLTAASNPDGRAGPGSPASTDDPGSLASPDGGGSPDGAGSAGCPDPEAVTTAARELMAAGAGAVVVSLGPGGLLAVTGEGTWRASPPGPEPGNPTGAGDAAVAGLARGLAAGQDWPERLRDAVALGTAAVAAPVAGEFSPARYRDLLPLVSVTSVTAAS